MNQHSLPGLKPAVVEQGLPCSERRKGHGRGRHGVKAGRFERRFVLGHADELAIAAPVRPEHGVDRVTWPKVRGPLTALGHNAGYVPAQHEWKRGVVDGGILACPKLAVGSADAGGLDLYQQFMRAGAGHRDVLQSQDLGSAERVDTYRPHGPSCASRLVRLPTTGLGNLGLPASLALPSRRRRHRRRPVRKFRPTLNADGR